MIFVRRNLTLNVLVLLGWLSCVVSVDESVLGHLDGRGQDLGSREGGTGEGGTGEGGVTEGGAADGDAPVPTTCAGRTWRASVSGVTLSLNGVWGSSVNDIWAVGTAGTIVHFDGSTWSKVTPAPTINNLYGVAGGASNDVWAVGSQVLLHFDGAAWKPAAGTSVSGTLRAVWVDASGIAWAVGDEGVAMRYQGGSWVSGTASTSNDLRAVWGSGPQDVWAAGDDGTVRHHDGTAWSSLPSASQKQLDGLHGLSASEIWSIGACTSKPNKCSSELLSHEGGTWTKIYTTPNGEQLHAVWPVASGDLVLAGEACCGNSSCTCGRIRRYWNGQSITQALGADPPPLHSIWGHGCDLWAVGDHGAIFRFSP